MDCPPLGWTTKGIVSRVIDGDTVEITVSRTFTVRLLDCWSPERHTQEGKEATRHLEGILPPGKPCVVHVPASKDDELQDMLTFGRLIGRIFTDHGDVSQLQVYAGFAQATKQR